MRCMYMECIVLYIVINTNIISIPLSLREESMEKRKQAKDIWQQKIRPNNIFFSSALRPNSDIHMYID